MKLPFTLLLKIFTRMESKNATTSSTLQDDIDRIVQLELELGEINKEDYYRSDENWEVVTVQQLSRLVPSVEWKDYIQNCLETGSTQQSGQGCGEDSNYRVKRYTRVKIPSRLPRLTSRARSRSSFKLTCGTCSHPQGPP